MNLLCRIGKHRLTMIFPYAICFRCNTIATCPNCGKIEIAVQRYYNGREETRLGMCRCVSGIFTHAGWKYRSLEFHI